MATGEAVMAYQGSGFIDKIMMQLTAIKDRLPCRPGGFFQVGKAFSSSF